MQTHNLEEALSTWLPPLSDTNMDMKTAAHHLANDPPMPGPKST